MSLWVSTSQSKADWEMGWYRVSIVFSADVLHRHFQDALEIDGDFDLFLLVRTGEDHV